ncbi:MAG: lysophospholipid acyltransferase family protein [Patescibacteria group bacterium]
MKLYFLSPFILQKIIWIPTRFSLFFFGHWKISGMDNLKGIPAPVIFACNHTSEIDPFFVPASLPFLSRFAPTFYTSRESKFYTNSGWRRYIYGGFFFKMWGSYPVHVGLNDYAKSMTHHIEIIRDGGSLCMFPEGRITPDGTIQAAKGGVAYLSQATGALIVPVRFEGAFGVSLKDLFLRRRHISIVYGKPMKPTDYLGSDPMIDELKNYAAVVMAEVGKL